MNALSVAWLEGSGGIRRSCWNGVGLTFVAPIGAAAAVISNRDRGQLLPS